MLALARKKHKKTVNLSLTPFLTSALIL